MYRSNAGDVDGHRGLRGITPHDADLAGGAAGMAVCAAYFEDAAAPPLWEASADALAQTVLPPWRFSGIAGIGWAPRTTKASNSSASTCRAPVARS